MKGPQEEKPCWLHHCLASELQWGWAERGDLAGRVPQGLSPSQHWQLQQQLQAPYGNSQGTICKVVFPAAVKHSYSNVSVLQ